MRRQHVAALLMSSAVSSLPAIAHLSHHCPRSPSVTAALLTQRRTAANAWTNRSNLKTGDWVCTRCGFVSAASQHRCGDCKATRSESCFLINQLACSQCKSVNHADNATCFSCQQPLSKSVLLAPLSAGGTAGIAAKQAGRLQRPEDVRVVKNWRCAYCGSSNPLVKATCFRCNKIKSAIGR
ncbi:Hypothetical protein, putative [Bodo saltans]|uniref:RanBP2-type domain-containing protein n=1 Tax=Bodo saltans TaxID=75058 RepID=A0A0S4IV00_BODSA|nr:Hypothetical protein, putative [Bodo saltans]|eukprot:CUF77790.1 Hypothetical protein, putative [Bodo saltans]